MTIIDHLLSFIKQKKFHLPKYGNFLLFSVLYHYEVNIFGFETVGQTKQAICRLNDRLCH